MSYTVDVVSVPVPPSQEDAWALRDRLYDARGVWLDAEGASRFEPPSERFRELHRRLTRRFPCIVDNEDGPWSDGPLINNFGQEIATLGISYSRVGEVLPFLIESSIDMGFVVFDGQDERIHRPPGAAEGTPTTEIQSRKWWQFWKLD